VSDARQESATGWCLLRFFIARFDAIHPRMLSSQYRLTTSLRRGFLRLIHRKLRITSA
jgi:hypothetical protein